MTITQAPTRGSSRVAIRLRDEDGIRFGIAHAGLVVSALLAGATGMSRPASFALLAATALAGGRGLAVKWRIGIAVAGWAIWTGFFENTLGLLTLSGPDLLRLTAFTVLAGVGTHLGPRRWARLRP